MKMNIFWKWGVMMSRENLSASKENSISFINEMKYFMINQLSLSGIDNDKAEAISTHIAHNLINDFGGMVLYFPKKFPDYASSRQSNIYDDYISGIPVTKLAAKFKLSMSRIYELMNIEKKLRLSSSEKRTRDY